MTVDLYVAGGYSRSFDLGSTDPKVRPTQRIRGLAFGRLGDRLIVAGADRLRCISLAPAAPNWTVVPPRSFGFLVSSPLTLAVSDSDYVAAGFDNGTIGIWTPLGSKLILRRESNAPRCIAFAENDDLVIGTDGFSLCSWDTARGRPRLRKLLGERSYGSACWKKGSVVAVRFLGSVGVMDVQTGGLIWARGVGVGLPLLAFEPETGLLAVPEEHAVTVYDFEGHELFRRSLAGGVVTSVAFHPKSGDIAIGRTGPLSNSTNGGPVEDAETVERFKAIAISTTADTPASATNA